MKIKLILLLTLLQFVVLSNFSAEDELDSKINWLTNLEEAQEISSEKGLSILVDFTGSDWCGWCIKLEDGVFSKEEFINFAAENLVMVKIDFPRKIEQAEETKTYNRKLADKYEIEGYPTILLLDEVGHVIAKTGFRFGGAKKYVSHIEKLLVNKDNQ